MAEVPALFEGYNIRRVWHNDEWWFAIVDFIASLTQTPDSLAGWQRLKRKLRRQGADLTAMRPFAFLDKGGHR